MKVLVIIPARGGSKGIPRKNLRSLNGKPLIHYAIHAALASRFQPDVYVSSDDQEILMVAAKLGARTHHRAVHLAQDQTTLEPVIYEAWRWIEGETGNRYALIVTLQPTSPLLRPESLDGALQRMQDEPALDTVLSARSEAHLSWRMQGGRYVPNYSERLNRQYLEPVFFETGAFVICRRDQLSAHKTRFGGAVDLSILPEKEATDIDTYADWNVCEYLIRRKTILFVVAGNDDIGLGHVYRTLILANSILNHRIVFLVREGSELGFSKIASFHYEAYLQRDSLLDEVARIAPAVVINDILDTDESYIRELRRRDIVVINFEDLGPGAARAHLVVNDLYPERRALENHYFGHQYFCARDEFLLSPCKKVAPSVKRVLLTMGGVDPCDLTQKVLRAIHGYCRSNGIEIDVVMGLGYRRPEALRRYPGIHAHRDIWNMSDFMLNADIVVTSAGRTVYEVACIGTPAIVVAQNERELTHFYASPDNGFVNLGLGSQVGERDILEAFEKLAGNFEQRALANQLMRSADMRRGRQRVIALIQTAIERTDATWLPASPNTPVEEMKEAVAS